MDICKVLFFYFADCLSAAQFNLGEICLFAGNERSNVQNSRARTESSGPGFHEYVLNIFFTQNIYWKFNSFAIVRCPHNKRISAHTHNKCLILIGMIPVTVA